MHGIKIPLQDFALKMQGELMREGGGVFAGHYDNIVHYLHSFPSTLFHSLEFNMMGDSGASALADALKVNQSLKTLKYVTVLFTDLKCKVYAHDTVAWVTMAPVSPWTRETGASNYCHISHRMDTCKWIN